MPTDSPQKSSDDILQEITEGNYTKLATLADFRLVLNQITMDLECDESEQKSQNPFNFQCSTPEGKNLGIHFFLKSVLTKGLNNIFDFFSNYTIVNKSTLSDDDIKKLIFLGAHHNTMYEAKINEANSTYSESDIKTTSSFLNFLSSLLNIRNIIEFETPGLIHHKGNNLLPNIIFGDPQKIDILIANTIKLNEDLTHILEYKKYNYTTENLLSFLESLGRFGFELKIKEEFQDFNHKIPEIASKIIHSTNLRNFSKEDKGLAGYTFLYEFDDKNEDQIKKDCVNLLGLADCPRPVTASTRLFRQIAEGHYTNQKPSFGDFVQVESGIKNNIDTLDRAEYIHVLDFLKNVLKTNDGSKNAYNFKSLYHFVFKSIDNLSNDLQQKNMLDDSFAQAAESLSFFLFNIVKNNVNNQDLLDQVHIITQFSKLYENIIIQAPHLDSLLDTMGNHLFSILARNIDSEPALRTGYREFVNIIKDLNKVCRENSGVCNLSKILAGSFKSLGSMSRKSSRYTLNATAEARALIEATRTHLNAVQLSDAVSFFFKANISQIDLDRQCKQKFNFTGCRPAIKINLDDLAYVEDEMATTLLPEELLIDAGNITTPPQITVPALAINQTGGQETSTVYSVPVYELPSTTEIITDIAQKLGSRLPSTIAMGATAAHGVGSGLVNIMTQATSIWLRNKGYGKSVISGISLSLASGILQASYVATFPLMLFKLNQLVAEGNEAEAQAQWEMMTQEMLPAFFTSLSLSTGLQLLNYLSENYLSKQSAFKSLIQSIPTLSTLWSFTRNPILTGIHVGTAYGVSAAGLFGFNRYVGARNHRNSDVEAANENTIEMQKLASSGETTSDTSTKNNTENSSSGEKLMYFIQKAQIEHIRKKLNDIKLNLEHMINIYSPVNEKLKSNIQTLNNTAKETNIESVTAVCLKEISELNNIINDNDAKLKLIDAQKSILDQYIEFFSDNRHLKACEGFADAEELLTNQHVKSLWGLIRTTMDNNVLGKLEKDLCKIIGTDPTKLIAGPDSSKNIEKLNSYISDIRFSASQAESTFKGALRIYDSKEQGVTAAKKLGMQTNEHENEVSTNMLHGTATFRRKNNGIVLTNRACSMYSDRTRSSGSDKSDASENSEFDPLFEQQQRQLIRP